MARPTVTNPLENAGAVLQPVAAPVDTFVRPQIRRKGGALLAALSNVDQLAQPILRQEARKAETEGALEGEALFLKNRVAFREAVRSGAIPAGASPHVRRGYRRAQMNALGSQYAVQLQRSLAESDLDEVEDPQEVEAYVQNFFNTFVENNGMDGFEPAELQETFGQLAQQAHNQFKARQVDANIQHIEEGRFAAFESELITALETVDWNGSEVDEAIGMTSSWLEAKAEELDTEGLSEERIKTTIIDMLSAEADRREDADILSVLGRTRVGNISLGRTRRGREKILAVRERIQKRQIARARAAAAEARAASNAAKKNHLRDVQLQLAQGIISGDLASASNAVDQLSQLDGRLALTAWRALNSAGDRMDEDYRQAQINEVISGLRESDDPLEYLADEAAVGRVDVDTIVRLSNDEDRRREDLSRGEASILRNPSVNRARQNIITTIDRANRDEGEDTARGAIASGAAVFELENRLMDLKTDADTKGEPLTREQIRQEAQRLQVEILEDSLQEVAREALLEQYRNGSPGRTRQGVETRSEPQRFNPQGTLSAPQSGPAGATGQPGVQTLMRADPFPE